MCCWWFRLIKEVAVEVGLKTEIARCGGQSWMHYSRVFQSPGISGSLGDKALLLDGCMEILRAEEGLGALELGWSPM